MPTVPIKDPSVPVNLQQMSAVAVTNEDKITLIAMFFRLSKDSMNNMENALATEGYKQWRIASHSLKGAAANMGMSTLEELCHQAEVITEPEYDLRSALLESIGDELLRVRDYLSAINPAWMKAVD